MKHWIAALLGSILVSAWPCEPSVAGGRSVVASSKQSVPLRSAAAGSLSRADTGLARVLTEYRSYVASGKSAAFLPSSKLVQANSNGIVIDARANSDGAALLADLEQLGLSNGSRYGIFVSGRLPLASIEAALELPSLRAMSAAPMPIRHAGSITSQGDAALRADIARSAFGLDGSGITVGVVSDSYDTLGGAAADVSSGDLPVGGVPVLNGESVYCGLYVFCVDEGRAMLQIIHDVAPGANLLFQSGIEGVAAYANAIGNLVANGADVIVDDLLLINEPMFQDGIVAQAIDTVTEQGAIYITAAGNSGRQSYEAPFDDSGEIFCIEFFEPFDDCDPMYERVGRMHDFDPGPGVDTYLNITVPVNSVMTLAMQWDQPYGGAGPTTDHDIVLLDGTGEVYVDIGANNNILGTDFGTGEGWEAIRFDNNEVLDYGSEFSIMITYDDVDSIDPPASLVKLVIFGQDVSINEWATNSGALFGHPNAAGAIATGAAFYADTPENGVSPPVLRTFSSAGGTPTLFDSGGLRLDEPEIRQAPEIVAADGVNTTFFFDDSIGNDGIDDFVGTSAAAPHAAGIAALLLQAKPGALPDQVRRMLQNTAVDMGAAGVDFDSGHGLVQADAAVAAILASYHGDMDGNGQADILWRNSATGENALYHMDGASIRAFDIIDTVASPDWQIVGNGDYDGDTNADILWRHGPSGAVWVYLMDGSTVLASLNVGTVSDANWKVVGNGDHNGDGKADILWHHAISGAVWLYEMDGNTVVTSTGIGTVPDTNWTIAGSGDYNGDGRADLLWRNLATGTNWVYLMDGPSILVSTGISVAPDLNWEIVGNGDYDGDGKSDILWRHATLGTNWAYLMNGTSIGTSASISVLPDASWKVVGDGDYNGDGKSDVLWRNLATGSNWLYLLDGLAIRDSASVNTVSDQDWKIVKTN